MENKKEPAPCLELKSINNLGLRLIEDLKEFRRDDRIHTQHQQIQRLEAKCRDLQQKLTLTEERNQTLETHVPNLKEILTKDVEMEEEIKAVKIKVAEANRQIEEQEAKVKAKEEEADRKEAEWIIKHQSELDEVTNYYEAQHKEMKSLMEEEKRRSKRQLQEQFSAKEQQMKDMLRKRNQDYLQMKNDYEKRLIKLEEELFNARKSSMDNQKKPHEVKKAMITPQVVQLPTYSSERPSSHPAANTSLNSTLGLDDTKSNQVKRKRVSFDDNLNSSKSFESEQLPPTKVTKFPNPHSSSSRTQQQSSLSSHPKVQPLSSSRPQSSALNDSKTLTKNEQQLSLPRLQEQSSILNDPKTPPKIEHLSSFGGKSVALYKNVPVNSAVSRLSWMQNSTKSSNPTSSMRGLLPLPYYSNAMNNSICSAPVTKSNKNNNPKSGAKKKLFTASLFPTEDFQ